MIYNDIKELVGNTPIVRLKGYEKVKESKATLLGKIESYNPSGSCKDRISKAMLEKALLDGIIKEDTLIIEPTSGNTGIGLAAICASLGLNITLVMPESMSLERRKLIQAYGATIALSPASKGMQGSIDMANDIHAKNPNSFICDQFNNQANPDMHYHTTGPEIYAQTEGKIDVFVAGVGTGGTISGVGKYLKEQNPAIEIVAVEPSDSPLLSKGTAGPHKIQGIGANFVPGTLNTAIYDKIVSVTIDDALNSARIVARKDGILIGISSGAALHAASILGACDQYQGKNIVVLLPDGGDRYFSTDLF